MADDPATARAQLKLVSSVPDDQEVVANRGGERRAHRRLTVSELSWLKHARIKYGPDV